MRLSFYPILQYFDGKGELLPAGDLPPLDDEVDPPPSDLGTGGETPGNFNTPVTGSATTTPTPQNLVPSAVSKVQYYKIDLYNTKSNLYGESVEKWYLPPYIMDCNVERGDITFTDTEYGVDENQILTLSNIKIEALITLDVTPEVGDIFIDQGRYFEVNGVNRVLLQDPNLGYQTDGTVGYVVNYVVTGYLTRTSKLNLVKYNS
jgi:hypothetical protein